jgi:hypothetical protein
MRSLAATTSSKVGMSLDSASVLSVTVLSGGLGLTGADGFPVIALRGSNAGAWLD